MHFKGYDQSQRRALLLLVAEALSSPLGLQDMKLPRHWFTLPSPPFPHSAAARELMHEWI